MSGGEPNFIVGDFVGVNHIMSGSVLGMLRAKGGEWHYKVSLQSSGGVEKYFPESSLMLIRRHQNSGAIEALARYAFSDHEHVGLLDHEQRRFVVEWMMEMERGFVQDGLVDAQYLTYVQDGYAGLENISDGQLIDEVASVAQDSDLPPWLEAAIEDRGWTFNEQEGYWEYAGISISRR